MKSLIHTVYQRGSAGLSNLIMSLELGVVLSVLTDRVLVLKGNHSPRANVVRYDGFVSNAHPSRITDLIDLGVPWIDAEQINLASLAPYELCDRPAWDWVFYYPAKLSTETDDYRSFARGRTEFVTAGEDISNVPALSFSGGSHGETLCFYSYFFYLDPAAQLQACEALRRVRPKPELDELAKRVARDLGSFNAAHIRRGDFKSTIGVTTLERAAAEAIEALDWNFSRDDRLVVLTDEAGDPFFDEIKAAYPDHVFLDHHILENYSSDFLELPARDSIALAYLSQLIAAESRDFIGSMTSTFTSIIQRMRGNLGKDEPFKFLWNELPEPGDKLERGRHSKSDCIRLEKGIMVEEGDGPYSWNRVNQRLNPGWMREWPESFLIEETMVERARNREIAGQTQSNSEAVYVAPSQDQAISTAIAFLDGAVAVSSNDKNIAQEMRRLFELMIAPGATPAFADIRIEKAGEEAKLTVDGKAVSNGSAGSKLLRGVYREIVCRFIDQHPEFVWLHAGCASSDTGAVVLPGPWGHGKSSLVLKLYDRGWSYLSDDITPVDTEKGEVLPFPGTPHVRPDAKRELPRERLGDMSKSAVSLDGSRVSDGPQPLSMIVFPQFEKGAPAELSPLSPAQAVAELLENCLSFTKNDDAAIQRLCALVERLPLWRLRFGDAAAAADVLVEAYGGGVADGPDTQIQASEAEMDAPPDIRLVDVEVTLEGGMRYASQLPSDSPILHDLYSGLASANQPDSNAQGTLIQLPLEGGQAACSFMSTSVVSLLTKPAVLVQPAEIYEAEAVPETDQASPRFVRIDGFLTPDENKQLLDYALASETDFESSTVSTGIEDYRKSRVLFSITESKWSEIFMARLKLHVPHIAAALVPPDFRLGKTEIQLTASNDGDYFKAHSDSGDKGEATAGREITYVYYLHRTPRPYSGGNLLLYHNQPWQSAFEPGVAVTTVAPENNCLIAFPSNRTHEVDVVRSPSGEFADSRFTVNGWLRREAS